MKKVMLRGEKTGILSANEMPKSLEYGVWYEFVTPFHWQYFRIKKGSRYVSVYDFIGDKKPQYRITKKRFLAKVIWLAKSPPTPVRDDEIYYA